MPEMRWHKEIVMDKEIQPNTEVVNNAGFGSLAKDLGRNIADNLKKRVSSLLGLLVVLAAVVAGNYYYQYQLIKNDPQKVVQEESKDLVAAVSELIVLPDGEQPTIATVSDPEALKGQAFFSKAKKGDKVLIYTNARKAILYNPTTHKIVEVAPLTIGNPATK